MDCKKAREVIEAGQGALALSAHLEGCAECRAERALWDLLGEARGLDPGPIFTQRALARMKQQEKGSLWEHLQALLGRGFVPTRALDEFSDFPPGSFGAVIFGGYGRAG
jgi:hypothetical protein